MASLSKITPVSLLAIMIETTAVSSRSGVAQLVQVQMALAVDLQVGHLVAVALLQVPAQAEHRRVFHRGGDQVLLVRIGAQGADDGQVVALGAAAGEDDLVGQLRRRAGRATCSRACGHRVAGHGAEAVHAGGVAVVLGQQGQHRLDDLGGHRGGGVVVEVDAALGRRRQARPSC